MKYIKRFEENNHNFEEDELVVSLVTERPKLLKGHRYYVNKIFANGMLYVNDAFNNELLYKHSNNFVSENEYIYGEEVKKYNL